MNNREETANDGHYDQNGYDNGDDSQGDGENNKNGTKRKRRSKNDQEGRGFMCECGKSYLSQPALTNHKKTKHDQNNSGLKRGRGRPRKNPLILPNSNENPEQRFKHFYDKDQRRKAESDDDYKATDFIDSLFTDIFTNYKDKCYTQTVQRPEDHPLFYFVLHPNKLGPFQLNEQGEEKRTTCDEIMHQYIMECASKANKEYFRFSFKFILLFRECINKFRQDEAKSEDPNKNFTETCNAEQAPDLCNEFITDFMENADFFGLNLDRERLELIEIIQHFCHWLYEKGYTTSRLTLLSG